jgi:hypothetical protein
MVDQSWIAILGTLGVGAVLGNLVTGLHASWRDRRNREGALRIRQLDELYGPLLSLRKEILEHSELRVKLQTAIDSPHMKALLSAPGGREESSDRHLDTVVKSVKDENETFRQLLMPRYHEMVKIFQNKMWLAEPATREHFSKLVEFVFV